MSVLSRGYSSTTVGDDQRCFRRCLPMRSLGARCCVIEYRYLDPDWRSEHRAFYASTFRRYPSIAHRLHFFLEPPRDDLRVRERPASFQGLTYLGYCVLRPVAAAPVGRTFLKPRTFEDLTCSTTDKVNLFGVDLEVQGAPFISQDAQLSRCAQDNGMGYCLLSSPRVSRSQSSSRSDRLRC
jgi:hypothetical protein